MIGWLQKDVILIRFQVSYPAINRYAAERTKTLSLPLAPGLSIQIVENKAAPVSVAIGGHFAPKRYPESPFTALGQVGNIAGSHGVADTGAGLTRNQRNAPQRGHSGKKNKQ